MWETLKIDSDNQKLSLVMGSPWSSVNAEDWQSKPWSLEVGSNPGFA